MFKIDIVDENLDINNISQYAEIPLFQKIKIVEEFGTKGYLYITSDQTKFFDQLDYYTLNNNKIKNGFLFNVEYVNFQDKTYSLKFEFENSKTYLFNLKSSVCFNCSFGMYTLDQTNCNTCPIGANCENSTLFVLKGINHLNLSNFIIFRFLEKDQNNIPMQSST